MLQKEHLTEETAAESSLDHRNLKLDKLGNDVRAGVSMLLDGVKRQLRKSVQKFSDLILYGCVPSATFLNVIYSSPVVNCTPQIASIFIILKINRISAPHRRVRCVSVFHNCLIVTIGAQMEKISLSDSNATISS